MFLSRFSRQARARTKATRTRATFQLRLQGLDERIAPSATHFLVKAPFGAQAGSPVPVLVAALDDSNHLVENYSGTAHFTSSDSGATLPADYTFGAGDHGFHLFQATFQAAGPDTVTATDTVTASITGTATVQVHPAPVATHFVVVGTPVVQAGAQFGFVVVALDAQNHPVPNYLGTVHFTSSDNAANLPADYTFVAGDHGFHKFNATLNTAGPQTLTATDTVTSSITGSANITVNPAAVATHFAVVPSKPITTAGVPVAVTVVALDASNHPVFNYTGTVHFTSSDGAAALPADYTFVAGDHGFHTFQVTLNTPGPQTVTATDTADSSIRGTANITVNPGQVATHFALVPASPFVHAGHAFTLYVVALDANNHIVSNYTGTVHFSSSDGAAVLPPDYTFTTGDHGYHAFTVTLNTPGHQTISVLDSVAMLNGSVDLFVL
jgi:hypothetical protein